MAFRTICGDVLCHLYFVVLRSMISRSPSKIPTPRMDSPDARTKNVAAGLRTRCSLRSSLPSMWSSAGLGNPAGTWALNSGSSSLSGESAKRSTGVGFQTLIRTQHEHCCDDSSIDTDFPATAIGGYVSCLPRRIALRRVSADSLDLNAPSTHQALTIAGAPPHF